VPDPACGSARSSWSSACFKYDGLRLPPSSSTSVERARSESIAPFIATTRRKSWRKVGAIAFIGTYSPEPALSSCAKIRFVIASSSQRGMRFRMAGPICEPFMAVASAAARSPRSTSLS
jgi:hypothetical protein